MRNFNPGKLHTTIKEQQGTAGSGTKDFLSSREGEKIKGEYIGTRFTVDIFKDGNFSLTNKKHIDFGSYTQKDGYTWRGLQLNDFTKEKKIEEICFKIRKLFLELEKELGI